MPGDDEALRIRPNDLTWRDVGGEVIALDLVTSTYFSTNRTGALLWRALVDGTSVPRLVRLLQDHFGISEEVAAEDVRLFLDDVSAHGLLAPPRDGVT